MLRSRHWSRARNHFAITLFAVTALASAYRRRRLHRRHRSTIAQFVCAINDDGFALFQTAGDDHPVARSHAKLHLAQAGSFLRRHHVT